jgi:hypothetical protein
MLWEAILDFIDTYFLYNFEDDNEPVIDFIEVV